MKIGNPSPFLVPRLEELVLRLETMEKWRKTCVDVAEGRNEIAPPLPCK